MESRGVGWEKRFTACHERSHGANANTLLGLYSTCICATYPSRGGSSRQYERRQARERGSVDAVRVCIKGLGGHLLVPKEHTIRWPIMVHTPSTPPPHSFHTPSTPLLGRPV
eukprot:9503957-Pyramimonas_sp.AAC.1